MIRPDDSLLAALAAAVKSGSTSAVALTTIAFERIESLDGPINAFVHLEHDGALATARDVDRRIAQGEDVGPLAGIPFGVKDLDDVAGMPTTKGSRWFEHAGPAEADDIHVARLRRAGAVPVGKTAAPEFGAAAFTANLIHGVTRNPWDLTKTPGGSSGGSAAAVTTGMVPFCTASDGGGSIRTPASFTGLPGLRPPYGRVPSFGSTHVAQNAVNFALTSSVADTALLLDICAGVDLRDRTCLPNPTATYRSAIETLDVRGLRVAFSPNFEVGDVDHEVEAISRDAFGRLVRAAELEFVNVQVSLPDFFETYSKIEGVDRWIDLADGLWPERASELNPSNERGWQSGARARLTQLGAVYTARRRLERQVADLFERFDVLVTPTAGVLPFAAEGPIPERINDVDVAPFVALSQPIMPSLCNLPAMSVPAGMSSSGLPVGIQIIAPLHRDDICLRLAHLFAADSPWQRHSSNDHGFEEIVASLG